MAIIKLTGRLRFGETLQNYITSCLPRQSGGPRFSGAQKPVVDVLQLSGGSQLEGNNGTKGLRRLGQKIIIF
jgi:hypothetical protein